MTRKQPAKAGRTPATGDVRLQRYLAMAGVAARRKAEDLITAGRVTVNGAVVTQLGTKVTPDKDEVLVDGEAVVALDHFYVLFNKPKGCITAVTDDRGRPTVMDYLPNLPVPVKPVGRLDFYTEGVLLLTNDGELAARLLAPQSHVPKTYHVKVRGRVEPRHVAMLRAGVRLDDGSTTLPADVEVLPAESKHAWLGITIHEGKQRQVHRMMEAFGYLVNKLQRVAFANLTFHGLRVGDARELDQQELNDLRDLVGLDHKAVARGRWRARREATDIPRRARGKAEVDRELERAVNEANRKKNEEAALLGAAGGPAISDGPGAFGGRANDRPARGGPKRGDRRAPRGAAPTGGDRRVSRARPTTGGGRRSGGSDRPRTGGGGGRPSRGGRSGGGRRGGR